MAEASAFFLEVWTQTYWPYLCSVGLVAVIIIHFHMQSVYYTEIQCCRSDI